VRFLSSALFWRILLSSLLVVGVLGFGLYRAGRAHEELDSQFERLVEHDLKLADDAEVMLRLMADLETGKRGFLLTNDRSFLAPYDKARHDVESVLAQAQATAENGMEDERVANYGRLLHEWIDTVSEPQIAAAENGGVVDRETTAQGKNRTDAMRTIANELRSEALKAANTRKLAAFESADESRRTTTSVILLAIVLALGSGVWIARDIANAASQLERSLDEVGQLHPAQHLEPRRDELGAVGARLIKVGALLIEKDASLRATLAEREKTLADLTIANANLAARDADSRAYAEFVRELKSLDVKALAKAGLQGLVRLAGGQIGVVYLLDSADRMVPIRAVATDGRAFDHSMLGPDGLPRAVMERREPVFLREDEFGATPPTLDLGVARAPMRWLLAQPVAVGEESAGTVLIAGSRPLPPLREEIVRDAARQLAGGLHNAWTHDRLREKSVMLAEQGESLSRANKVKTEFLASMSHELRTPLSAILGFADLLQTSPKETLSPRARESLERIKRNGEHLLSLINDILDLAKAEAGRLDVRFAPVNIPQLARACVAEVDSLRAGNEVQLRADVDDAPLEIRTDVQRVRQILLNLLSNALKFTTRGEVVLAVQATPDELRLEVRDTGIGIPAHAMGELFRDFHQLDVGDGRKYAGTGIGLALSRRLARALGGEIEVRSREREGSIFTLVLPRSLGVPSAEPRSASLTPPSPSDVALPSGSSSSLPPLAPKSAKVLSS
jgi:signal transduction histidine kinase/CHASE3 domain sensor protein